MNLESVLTLLGEMDAWLQEAQMSAAVLNSTRESLPARIRETVDAIQARQENPSMWLSLASDALRQAEMLETPLSPDIYVIKGLVDDVQERLDLT
jgi:hypothetical protein